jgi:hypothetical protein
MLADKTLCLKKQAMAFNQASTSWSRSFISEITFVIYRNKSAFSELLTESLKKIRKSNWRGRIVNEPVGQQSNVCLF